MLANELREAGKARDGWIDVSVPLRSGMARWPDNPPVVIERMLDIGCGDAANVSKISIGSHTGAHMDAPLHFVREGKGLDEMPLGATMGRARVIEVQDPEAIKPHGLRKHEIRGGERILFKTRNSAGSCPTRAFIEDFVYVSRPGRSRSSASTTSPSAASARTAWRPTGHFWRREYGSSRAATSRRWTPETTSSSACP